MVSSSWLTGRSMMMSKLSKFFTSTDLTSSGSLVTRTGMAPSYRP